MVLVEGQVPRLELVGADDLHARNIAPTSYAVKRMRAVPAWTLQRAANGPGPDNRMLVLAAAPAHKLPASSAATATRASPQENACAGFGSLSPGEGYVD